MPRPPRDPLLQPPYPPIRSIPPAPTYAVRRLPPRPFQLPVHTPRHRPWRVFPTAGIPSQHRPASDAPGCALAKRRTSPTSRAITTDRISPTPRPGHQPLPGRGHREIRRSISLSAHPTRRSMIINAPAPPASSSVGLAATEPRTAPSPSGRACPMDRGTLSGRTPTGLDSPDSDTSAGCVPAPGTSECVATGAGRASPPGQRSRLRKAVEPVHVELAGLVHARA